MPKYAANLSMLFTELSFLDRFEAAADAGFSAVEVQFPYAFAADDIRARLVANGLSLVLHNMPAGNWEAGDRGIACDPDRAAEFAQGIDRAIDYATVVGCDQVNCIAGVLPLGVPPEEAHATLIDNLRFAADKLEAAGIGLLIEPINTFDIPDFVVSRSNQAIDIIDETESANIKLQYDLYHMQRMEGVTAEMLIDLLPRIGHIQIADSPGRHEPGTGEIDFAMLLPLLDQFGYLGWVGCEWVPQRSTHASLARFTALHED